MPKRPCTGARCDRVVNISETLTNVRELGFEFLCTPMVVSIESLQRHLTDKADEVTENFSWLDLDLPSSEWTTSVVGIVSDVVNRLKGQNSKDKSQELLKAELDYGQHLGLPAIIMELNTQNFVSFARIIHARLTAAIPHQPYWLKVPIHFEESENNDSSWDLWNKFRLMCNSERRLNPVLEIGADLPDEEVILRWLGEPVKCLFVSSKIFTTNGRGFPVLPKAHQNVIKQFYLLGSQVVIDIRQFDDLMAFENKYYKQYIDYLYNAWSEERDTTGIRHFTAGYEDYLQCPLQPLMDNLESHTYEVFEKDPTKYNLYEDAIYEALLHKIKDSDKETNVLVVMVVGAGRGPLVRVSIKAASRAERKIKLYAVEKNRNAINTLVHLKKNEWGDLVTIISGDMREWNAPEKADLMISELLGSFGDNELSPECLDGAQKFLKDDGIMIPQSYSSFIGPIMSAKLWNEVRAVFDTNKHKYAHFETPYVVHMQNRYEISPPQELFTFHHPNTDVDHSNDQTCTLAFAVDQNTVLHGFAGYFESTLFNDIKMSILPKTFSQNLFSWFPMYFPIREIVQLKKGDKLSVTFWRCSSKSSVWYEWAVESPTVIPIHNPNGRSYTIGL